MKSRVCGKSMTAAEKKAMDLEIKKQFAEFDRKHTIEIDAMVLWILHSEFGFGEKRLKRFFDLFNKSLDDLLDRYEFEDEDQIWLCTYMLKRDGIDIEAWEKELEENEKHEP